MDSAAADTSLNTGDRAREALLKTVGVGDDWDGIVYSYDEQRFSPLTDINDRNVGELGIAWYADLEDARGQEATPVVVDGVMYVSHAWSKVDAWVDRKHTSELQSLMRSSYAVFCLQKKTRHP